MKQNSTQHFKKKSVPFNILKEWQMAYKPGDQSVISKKYFLTKSTVCWAFKGIASPNTIRMINEYYGENLGKN